jgi:Ser/Thr protein kinase RdoA (MazF antagonist)
VARAAPEFADRAARLLASLAMASAQLPEPPASLIHGDFHPEQVWIDEGRVVLFDFDEFAAGDPMEDLAEFVVKLGPIDPGARFATLLLAAYAQTAPSQFSQRRLQWHLAVQQLLQASRAFVFQIEGWRGHLELRLARAEALCPTPFQESVR